MILFIPHYLPPMSFGGCEELTLALAARTGGLLYCPRPSNHRANMVTGHQTFRDIYARFGISLDRVLFLDDRKMIPWDRVSRVVLMGLYWPRITAAGIREVPAGIPIDLMPAFHVHDDGGRLSNFAAMRESGRVGRIFAFSGVEAAYVGSRLANATRHVFRHLPGIVIAERQIRPFPVFYDGKGVPVAPAVAEELASGYALFPSRASKNLVDALVVSRVLGLPLVGNLTYSLGGKARAYLNFDECEPYDLAKVCISLGRKDSYCLAVARSILSRVPVVWDNANTQIVEIWTEYTSAAGRHGPDLPGRIQVARGVEGEDERLRKEIARDVLDFLSVLGS